MRLDLFLTERGSAQSRQRAKTMIENGDVELDGTVIKKPSFSVSPGAHEVCVKDPLRYVSRGGLKLEAALNAFSVDPSGVSAVDIGASTGGFVDCALQNGAVKVFAIDVGYNQLDWKLRSDARVVNMEKTNARYLEADSLGEQVDVITTDVSFISLEKILPPAMAFLKEGGHVLALIKPQFEAGREKVGKKGVVRDPAVHIEVVQKILNLCDEMQLTVWGLDYSPIKGPEGNIEYLLWGCKDTNTDFVPDVKAVVAAAHGSLDQ